MLDEGRPRRRRVAYWVAYVAALLLTACGSGGGGSTAAPGAISVAVSGLASKAPIANATVTVYRLAADGTRDLPPLATATTGLSGDYALVMRAPVATPVAVAFTGGSYVDEATGATLSLGADDALEAYAQVPANGILSVNVTPLTTLAAALARKHVQQDGQSLSAAITNATAEISTLFDVGDILETTPPPLSGLDTASQNEKNYALFLAGFSQLAENDGTQTVFALIKAMAADLQADGILGNAANALTPQNLVAATDQFLNNTNYSATLSAQGAGAVSQPRIDIATIAGKIAAHTNHAPTAGNLVLPGFLEDTVGSGVLSGSDPDAGDILSFSIVRNGEKGTAAITDASTGSFTYTPQPNANGQDSFTYLVSDGASGAYGTVTVTIIAVNDAPVAVDGVVNTDEDTPVSHTLQANDSDSPSLTYSIVANGIKGTAVITDAATGAFTYTPNLNANGTDSFTFRANDGTNDSNTATETVMIAAVNDAPVITSTANTSATQDTAYSYQVTASDPDVGDSLTYALTTSPAGMTIGATTGLIQWTPTNGDAISNGGNHAVVVQVSDNGVPAKQASQSFTIHVANDIAMLATATASSAMSGQGAAQAIDGVVDGYINATTGDPTKEWATNGEGAGAWLRLEWTQCYEVDRVRLYDRPNLGDRILGATLRFSDGSTVAVGALPNDGSLLELTFPARCTDSVTLEITAVSGTTVNVGLAEIEVFGPVVDPTVIQTVLLRQDFDSGAASGWTPVDDAAATHTPSAWSVVNDQYQEDSGARYPDDVGIFGETPAGYELATYSRYDGFIHGDMDLRLQLRSDDIGVLGVMFGYQDNNNYYRFSLSKRDGHRTLEKRVAGGFSELANSQQSYTTGQWLTVRIVMVNGVIIVFVDGDQVLAAKDTTFSGGKIALWASRNGRSVFDNIVILSPPSLPVIGLSSPIEYAVSTGVTLTTAAAVTTAIGVGGVEFVVDEGTGAAVSQSSYAAPFTAQFDFPQAGTHEARAYVLDSQLQRLTGAEAVDSNPGIGVGGYNLVGFGDSITDGVGDDLPTDDVSSDGRNTSGGYETALNDALTAAANRPVTVIDEGGPADTSLEGVGKITTVKSRNPGAQDFLVMFGTNDSSGSLPTPSGLGLHTGDAGYSGSYKDAMQQIISAITGAGKKVFLAKVPPHIGGTPAQNTLLQAYNQVIDQLVSENAASGKVFIGPDFYTYFTNNPSKIGADGIHPTGAGYAAMGVLWKNSVLGNL